MSDETIILLAKAKAQSFNCRFVGLIFIHNYLMLLRDKNSQVIRDASQLVLLDIRSLADFDIGKVFKSQSFNLLEFLSLEPNSADFKQKIKNLISMKYLFVIGEPRDFDTENFRNFLDTLIKMDGGKPF